MGKTTGIEWCDSTWNPIRGCSRVSEGCRNCYAETVAARFSGPGRAYHGLATFKTIGEGTPAERVEAHWTGEVRLIEKHLGDPLAWKKPARIFVNSMSDLFHPGVRDEWLAAIFDVMARAPQHTYIVLTKRPERMREALAPAADPAVSSAFERAYAQPFLPPNWWFGVSVEDQKTADHRVPILLKTCAETRFISYEPALGPVDFAKAAGGEEMFSWIDWLIVGGESGPHERPMHPEWARSARDLCLATGVSFFFKQWGEWLPVATPRLKVRIDDTLLLHRDGSTRSATWTDVMASSGDVWGVQKVGKHNAGSHLDGVELKEFPQC